MAKRQKISIGQWLKQCVMFNWSSTAKCSTCGRTRDLHVDELIALPLLLTDSLSRLEGRLRCRGCGGLGARINAHHLENHRSNLDEDP